MKSGRIILMAGLPAGLGASTVSLALAEALCGLGRSVLLLSPLATLGDLSGSERSTQTVGPACILRQAHGPDLAPLEFCDESRLPQALPQLARETDFVLVDRFTGLHVKNNIWYAAAGEVLLLVDGRAGMDTRSLMLAGHIVRHWPDRALYLLHNRMSGPFNWHTMAKRFVRRVERHHGVSPVDLGCLPDSPEIGRASREGKAFTRMYPNHPGSRQLRQVARQLLRSGVTGQSAVPLHDTRVVPIGWANT